MAAALATSSAILLLVCRCLFDLEGYMVFCLQSLDMSKYLGYCTDNHSLLAVLCTTAVNY